MEICSLTIDTIALTVAIISMIIAAFSLWMMWKINKTTSKFAKDRAKKEDQFYEAILESQEKISKSTLDSDSKIDDIEKITTNNLENQIEKQVTKVSNIIEDEKEN